MAFSLSDHTNKVWEWNNQKRPRKLCKCLHYTSEVVYLLVLSISSLFFGRMIIKQAEGVNHRQRCHFCVQPLSVCKEVKLEFLENFYHQKYAKRWEFSFVAVASFTNVFPLLEERKSNFSRRKAFTTRHKKIGIIYNQCQDNWFLIYICLDEEDECVGGESGCLSWKQLIRTMAGYERWTCWRHYFKYPFNPLPSIPVKSCECSVCFQLYQAWR